MECFRGIAKKAIAVPKNLIFSKSTEFKVMAEYHIDLNHIRSGIFLGLSNTCTTAAETHKLQFIPVFVLSLSSTNFGCPVWSTPCLIAPSI